jgi:guanylate kinase
LKGKHLLERKSKGSLFVVSAASGTGKTTLCRKLVSSLPNLKFSVSFTTRAPRSGEMNDKDYTFVSKDEFKAMIDREEFAEWAEVHGELYGTLKNRIDKYLNAKIDVLLDIDTQGAAQIKKKYQEGIYIFILPPSLQVLKERLEKRMTNSKEQIDERLKNAVEEIKSYSLYDYVIINNTIEVACKELEAIVISRNASIKMVNPQWIKDIFLNRR